MHGQPKRRLSMLRWFGSSGLRLDMPWPPLTNLHNRGGDVEKRPRVTFAGAHFWPTRANTETNGERRKS
jgi:hypothetical protein